MPTIIYFLISWWTLSLSLLAFLYTESLSVPAVNACGFILSPGMPGSSLAFPEYYCINIPTISIEGLLFSSHLYQDVLFCLFYLVFAIE